MTEQPALFQPDRPCPVPGCGAILTNGQQPPIVTCRHDLDPPDQRPYRRPKGCVNHYDPATAPFPEGF